MNVNLVGYWSTTPVDDGGASDLSLIFLSNGTGIIFEFNWYLLYVKDIMWSLEGDFLKIEYKNEDTTLNGLIKYTKKVTVTDICGKNHILNCFTMENKALDFEFFRIPLNALNIEELDIKLREQILALHEEFDDFYK